MNPGFAVVCQDSPPNHRISQQLGVDSVTAAIGEVWIPKNSNTKRVCDKLIHDWGCHKGGRILCYGDATGGARGSAKVEGSDWELISKQLKQYFGSDRVRIRVPKGNPHERTRINAVNSRLKSADGSIHTLVDPKKAPHLVRDLEGVIVREGSAGEIDKNVDDKNGDKNLTHISDAFGYMIVRRHPISGGMTEDDLSKRNVAA